MFVGFNLTFFPQFILGYLGHAAPLRDVSAGVPGVQRALDGRRDDARRRLPASRWSTCLVAGSYGKPAGDNPWGVEGPRVGDDVAAADVQLRRTPIVTEATHSYAPHTRRSKLPDAALAHAGAHARRHPRLQHHFDTMAQQKAAASLGMWVFLAQEIMFFGGMFAAYLIYRMWYFAGYAAASQRARSHARRHQHRRPDRRRR